ncbi:MAG: RNA polymerase sigma factor [Polaromonas sp.]|nr:RNA polymerase sigma factor [Polaromonas sp.]
MASGWNILPSDDDLSLIKRIGLRDTAAMETCCKRHASSVYSFAFRRMSDAALADEVVNDTLLQAWVSAKTFTGQSSPKTWLLGIAKNKILDALRRKARLEARTQDTSEEDQQAFADTAPGVYALLLAKQQSQHLSQCFDDLPPEQRDCIHFSFVEGMTLAEIAQVMTIPANTVATRIHHAKRKLRDCMEWIFGKGEVF